MAISQKAVDFLGRAVEKGRPIPGQSLTNSPDQPYAWERPPEFTEPRQAMYEVFDVLTEQNSSALGRYFFYFVEASLKKLSTDNFNASTCPGSFQMISGSAPNQVN